LLFASGKDEAIPADFTSEYLIGEAFIEGIFSHLSAHHFSFLFYLSKALPLNG